MKEYFRGVESLEDLEKQYKEYVRLLHPDRGGDPIEYIRMKQEYERLRVYFEEVNKRRRQLNLLDLMELLGEVAILIKRRL